MKRAKTTKRSPPTMMDRTRAARAYVNQAKHGDSGDLEMYAFMAIFHPEVSDDKVRELVRGRRR